MKMEGLGLLERVLSDGLGEMLFVVSGKRNGEFKFEWINRPARENFGFGEEAIGSNVRDVLGDQVGGLLTERYREVAESGGQAVYEDHFYTPDGAEWFTEVTLTPLPEERDVRYIAVLAKDITGRKQGEFMRRGMIRRLEESTSRFRALFENNGDAVLELDPAGVIIEANTAALRLLGLSSEALDGKLFSGLIPEQDRCMAEAAFSLAADGRLQDVRVNVMTENGGLVGCLLKFTPIDRDGKPIGYYANLKDMRELDKLADLYLESQNQFKIIADNVRDVIVTIDGSWRLLYASPSAKPQYGYEVDDVVGKATEDLIHPDDFPDLVRGYKEILEGRHIFRIRLRVLHKNGDWIWSELNASPVRGPDGEFLHMVIVVRDISRQKAEEERLEHYAYHDQLTGLPNRRLFLNRLEDRVNEYHRTGRPFAVALMDLDRFKKVNDTWGHSVGDDVIRAFSHRIEDAADHVLAARFGGDEFVILIADCSTHAQAEMLAGRIIAALKEPIVAGGHVIPVSTSIGIAFAAPGRTTTDVLLKLADRAMYEAKQEGPNRYRIVE
ncbi:PAS domain S-box protein [Bhargavaea ginsengi]|uniref:sensor domain-containing protein n=1 Tax=Bhargavaea ginsengi TaxID=426757 RepID=UPI00203EF295|nr:PAS domain S-box protein [Bhargavaea ginsengi]MCM3087816.1 PAS domain S-box protein [Bhargavaea ginsengi]